MLALTPSNLFIVLLSECMFSGHLLCMQKGRWFEMIQLVIIIGGRGGGSLSEPHTSESSTVVVYICLFACAVWPLTWNIFAMMSQTCVYDRYNQRSYTKCSVEWEVERLVRSSEWGSEAGLTVWTHSIVSFARLFAFWFLLASHTHWFTELLS